MEFKGTQYNNSLECDIIKCFFTGTAIYADSCGGWCDYPNSWNTINVYCNANGYVWSTKVHTTLDVYTVAGQYTTC